MPVFPFPGVLGAPSIGGGGVGFVNFNVSDEDDEGGGGGDIAFYPSTNTGIPLTALVDASSKYKPLTGVFATESEIKGWRWDRRVLESVRDAATRYREGIGGISSGLFDGIPYTHWQSGAIHGLKYYDTVHKVTGAGDITWTPRVETGQYSVHHQEHTLYSDCAVTSYFNRDNNVDGLMLHTLDANARNSSISVGMYYRTDKYTTMRRHDFKQVSTFTGSLAALGGTRLETDDGAGNFIAGTMDPRAYEYVIKDGVVYLNQDYKWVQGDATLPISEIPVNYDLSFERKGTGNSNGRTVYTNYFPLQPGSLRVITDVAGLLGMPAIYDATEVSNFDLSGPTDAHMIVDYDLGTIQFGGYQAPDLGLRTALDAFAIEVVTYPDPSFGSYPETGYIKVEDEWIFYASKSEYTFRGCIRGALTTVAAAHAVGVDVVDRQHGLGIPDSKDIYVAYTAVPRIEYEVTDHTLRTANGSWLDVRPARNVRTNAIVQIVPAITALDSLTLVADAPSLGGVVYGPVFYGTGVSRLTATALDPSGAPLDGLDITIKINSGPGNLNNGGSASISNSNSLGETYAYYNAPQNGTDLERIATAHATSGGDTLLTFAELDGVTDVSDVWLFQILKWDKLLGTLGTQGIITATTSSTPPYGFGKVTIDKQLSKDFEGGIITTTDGTTGYTRKILMVEPDTSTSAVATTVFLDAVLPAGVATKPVFAIEKDAVTFQPDLLNGVRRLVYQWDTGYQHPVTGAAGAYAPVKPDAINSNVLTYSEALPAPSADTISNNVAAYVAISGAEIEAQAFAKDPVTGRIFMSNTIRIRVSLPPSWVGVDSSGVLPIPHGLKLVTDESNVGGALGGANFLTVNPVADGINQVTIKLDI